MPCKRKGNNKPDSLVAQTPPAGLRCVALILFDYAGLNTTRIPQALIFRGFSAVGHGLDMGKSQNP
jgi:hypothetical protein